MISTSPSKSVLKQELNKNICKDTVLGPFTSQTAKTLMKKAETNEIQGFVSRFFKNIQFKKKNLIRFVSLLWCSWPLCEMLIAR